MTRELLDLRTILRRNHRRVGRQSVAHHDDDRGALLLEHVAAFIAGLAATAIVGGPEPGDTRAVHVVAESLRFALHLHRNDVPGLDRHAAPLEQVLLSHRLVTDERGTITWYADEELEAESSSHEAAASHEGGRG